jgi:hypothetical protein
MVNDGTPQQQIVTVTTSDVSTTNFDMHVRRSEMQQHCRVCGCSTAAPAFADKRLLLEVPASV